MNVNIFAKENITIARWMRSWNPNSITERSRALVMICHVKFLLILLLCNKASIGLSLSSTTQNSANDNLAKINSPGIIKAKSPGMTINELTILTSNRFTQQLNPTDRHPFISHFSPTTILEIR